MGFNGTTKTTRIPAYIDDPRSEPNKAYLGKGTEKKLLPGVWGG